MERKEVVSDVKELLERWHAITYKVEKKIASIQLWLTVTLFLQFSVPAMALIYLDFTHQIEKIESMLSALLYLGMASVGLMSVMYLELVSTSTLALRAIMPKVVEVCTDEGEEETEGEIKEEGSNDANHS